MSPVCVYIDGFSPSDLSKRPNAFSEWHRIIIGEIAYFKWRDASCPEGMDLDFWLVAEREYRQHSRLIINQRANETESLRTRWGRLQQHLVQPFDKSVEVRVLAYSLGCHLAARFAAQLQEQEKINIKSFQLIAPDPKFRPNELDATESRSAYDQAKEFWETSNPAEFLCANLRKISETVRVQIIYSEVDEVALWEGNAEIMQRRCVGDRFEWSKVSIGSEKTIAGALQVELKPDKACSEFWIHEQLFTEAKRSAP